VFEGFTLAMVDTGEATLRVRDTYQQGA